MFEHLDHAERIVSVFVKTTRIPVLMEDGFHNIEVTLEPGQRKTIHINGRTLTVVRELLH
jgi:hypothetical protein